MLSVYWMGEEHGINNVYSKDDLSDKSLLSRYSKEFQVIFYHFSNLSIVNARVEIKAFCKNAFSTYSLVRHRKYNPLKYAIK